MQERMGLARLAVDYWKLLRAFERLVADVSPEQAAKVEAQWRFSSSRLHAVLNEQGLVAASFDGQPYEPNLPVTAINTVEVAGQERLVIEQTIEPAIIDNTKVLLMGKVVLKRENGHVSRD